MAIPLWASRAEVFKEFSAEDQKKYFDLKQKKVIANYDNFYYTVFLKDDKCGDLMIDVKAAEENQRLMHTQDGFLKMLQAERAAREKKPIEKITGIKGLLIELNKLRSVFDFKSEDKLDFYGLDYYPFGLKFYNNKLTLDECFDILICNSVPNKNTPRIMVQLRARYLWQYGFKKCFQKSLKYLQVILKDFEIEIDKVQENRIDYAHHTNCIQSFEKFFDRKKLVNSCKTTARIYNHVGDPLRDWSIDYLSVGSRSAKSVFFRAYNKTREVVELAYKSFFFGVWRDNGLISEYDQYCLEQAFEVQSYDVGLLIGRINWYLEHGSDVVLIGHLKNLKKKCYADNCNTTKLRKAISGILPDVTVICNLEFETHTDFYRSFNNSLLKVTGKSKSKDLYSRVYKIFDCRKAFLEYMTSYEGSVAFMDNILDIQLAMKEARNRFTKVVSGERIFDKEGYNAWKALYIKKHYAYFWKRVRSAKVGTRFKPELYREYERKVDIERQKRKLTKNLATLSILKNGPNNVTDLNEDLSQFYSLLNDNDMHVIGAVYDDGTIAEVNYGDYYTVKQRANRQLRSIISTPAQDEE